MLGDRLKLARKKSGYSMDALVARLDGEVTKQSLSKYEHNLMMPGSRVLSRLSNVLDVSLEFLMSTDVVALEGVDFRTKSNTSVKERLQVEAIVIEHAERYLAIEDILGEQAKGWNESEKTVIRNERDADDIAAKYRERWALGMDPIPNLTALLEELGLKVLLLDLPEKVSGLTCFVKRQESSDIPVIVANKNMNVERRRFTLAHELFHRLVVVPADSGISEEKLINRCAGAFLMPSRMLINELGLERVKISYQEYCSIKHQFGVSITALIVRLGQLGILSEPSVTHLFRSVARDWRRSEPDPINESDNAPLEQPERFQRLCFRAFSERYISRAKLMELLQLSYEDVEMAMKVPSQHANHR